MIMYEIVQLTKEGEPVDVVRGVEADMSSAELKRCMFVGVEHESFIIRRHYEG